MARLNISGSTCIMSAFSWLNDRTSSCDSCSKYSLYQSVLLKYSIIYKLKLSIVPNLDETNISKSQEKVEKISGDGRRILWVHRVVLIKCKPLLIYHWKCCSFSTWDTNCRHFFAGACCVLFTLFLVTETEWHVNVKPALEFIRTATEIYVLH